MNKITLELVKKHIVKREKNLYKGICGKVLILAGSERMTGAAILASKAAFRAGSGLVYVSLPEKSIPIVQMSLPEAICYPRIEEETFQGYDAIGIGCGLGRGGKEIALLKAAIEYSKCPLILDADGLNIVSEQNLYGLLKKRKSLGLDTVITPHWREGMRLLGSGYEKKSREEILLALMEKTGAITVLKGAETLVGERKDMDQKTGEMLKNTTGNPSMATAGSGDVLAGIITSLCGQKADGGRSLKSIEPFIAAQLGVFIHGMAGDLAAKELGEYGVMAGDLCDYTSLAIKHILE